MYEDDFYKPDDQIPINEEFQLADWDCPEAFDLSKLAAVLDHIHATGEVPPQYISKEEKNETGVPLVSDEVIEQIKSETLGRNASEYQFVIVDGIMLYHQQSPVIGRFDTKFLLRAEKDVLRNRRELRNGYVTMEGFWQDPPGYFDQIVWPGYERNHRYLFENEDVSGRVSQHTQSELKIQLPLEEHIAMSDILKWALMTIMREL